MRSSIDVVDLSDKFVTTVATHDVIPSVDANHLAHEVYGEFSGGALIHEHIIELAAKLRPGVRGTIANRAQNLRALRQFDYLRFESLDRQALRIKAIIAINMVCPEIFEDELSARLVEPFEGVTVLPSLYEAWKNKPRFS